MVASSPEEARQVVINNADYVLQDLLSRKLQNGKKVLPRGSALPVEEKRVGKADPGTITTMGLKKMLTPDGVQSFKFTNGKIVDGAHVQGGEQVEEANSFLKPGPQTTGKFPEPRKPSFQGDQGSKSETLGRDGLIYHWQDPRAKQGMAEASKHKMPKDWDPKAPFNYDEWKNSKPKTYKRKVEPMGTLPAKKDKEQGVAEEKQRLDPKCWTGYKKQGTKMKGDTRVNNCVKVDEAEFTEDKLASDLYRDLQIFKKGAPKDIGSKAKDKEIGNKPQDKDIVAKEDWQKTNKQDKTDGMSPKAVKAYRRENPGSKLKTAVTKKPSELKAGSKDANRRKSFCARMSGNKGPMKDENGKPTPKAKALKRWNC